jgi:hypothetical protein
MSEAWEHILKTKNYKDENSMIITADDIKNSKKTWTGSANQFEPRLLAYIPSLAHRPEAFKKNNLYILPVRNGTYMLTKHNIYKELEYKNMTPILIQKDTTSMILAIGNSETSVIDNLRYSGVFERPEILNEKITHGPLLNGRHRCDIDMKLFDQNIAIRGVQYEVDSCYETKNKILIIEGKSGDKPFDSFNIRQLYFPFRAIKSVVGEKKEIICLFVHNLKGVIHIWKYTFQDTTTMNSIKELGYYTYKFSS